MWAWYAEQSDVITGEHGVNENRDFSYPCAGILCYTLVNQDIRGRRDFIWRTYELTMFERKCGNISKGFDRVG